VRPQAARDPRRARIDSATNAEHVRLQTARAQVVREERDALLDFPFCDEFFRDVHFRGDAPLPFGGVVLCHVLPLQVCGCLQGQGSVQLGVNGGYFAGNTVHLQRPGWRRIFSFKCSPVVDLNARARRHINVGNPSVWLAAIGRFGDRQKWMR